MKNILDITKKFFRESFHLNEWPESLDKAQRKHLRKEFGGPRITVTDSWGTGTNAFDNMWENGTVINITYHTGQYSSFSNKTCYVVQLDNRPDSKLLFLREELSHPQSKPIPQRPPHTRHFILPKDQAKRVEIQLEKIVQAASINAQDVTSKVILSKDIEFEYTSKEFLLKPYNKYQRRADPNKENRWLVMGKPHWGDWRFSYKAGGLEKEMDISDCKNKLEILNKALPLIHTYIFPDEYPLSPEANNAIKNYKAHQSDIEFTQNKPSTSLGLGGL